MKTYKIKTLSEINREIIRAIRHRDVDYLLEQEVPREFIREIEKLMGAYHMVGDILARACRNASVLSLEQYAKIVLAFPKVFHPLLFENYERGCYAKEFTHEWTGEQWENCLYEMSKLKLDLTSYSIMY